MGYIVIHNFFDLQDCNYPYKTGDSFPRHGFSVGNSRINELAGRNNKQNKPLIELAKEGFSKYMTPPEKTEEVSYTKTEINRMSTAELKALAVSVNIADADSLTGGELKKMLIKHYGL